MNSHTDQSKTLLMWTSISPGTFAPTTFLSHVLTKSAFFYLLQAIHFLSIKMGITLQKNGFKLGSKWIWQKSVSTMFANGVGKMLGLVFSLKQPTIMTFFLVYWTVFDCHRVLSMPLMVSFPLCQFGNPGQESLVDKAPFQRLLSS